MPKWFQNTSYRLELYKLFERYSYIEEGILQSALMYCLLNGKCSFVSVITEIEIYTHNNSYKFSQAQETPRIPS